MWLVTFNRIVRKKIIPLWPKEPNSLINSLFLTYFSFFHSPSIIYPPQCRTGGRRVIGISGSLIWSRTLVELNLTPVVNFGEVRMVQLNQIHSPHLHVGPLGSFRIFSGKREWGAEGYGKLPHLFFRSKTAVFILYYLKNYAMVFLYLFYLQPRLVSAKQ